MKIAIVSDIHSNLEAWETVKEDIVKEKADKTFCLGDVVGYGANPSECLESVKSFCEVIIRGNHENETSAKYIDYEMSPHAREGVLFSKAHLSPEQIEYILKLPTSHIINEFDMVLFHGSQIEPHYINYVFDHYDAKYVVKYTKKRICVLGHTHSPFVYTEGDNKNTIITTNMKLNKGKKFVINVGSVGQPRDGVPYSSYGIFEIKDGEVYYTNKRVKYDIDKTIKRMKEAGISKYLYERLLVGH